MRKQMLTLTVPSKVKRLLTLTVCLHIILARRVISAETTTPRRSIRCEVDYLSRLVCHSAFRTLLGPSAWPRRWTS
eukprot:scaffold66304_cov48-Prasinocladus_malaysianus.AAC.1